MVPRHPWPHHLRAAHIRAGRRRPGRTAADQITYYKSIGVPIQDLLTAQHMARRAEKSGIGVEIEIGGERD